MNTITKRSPFFAFYGTLRTGHGNHKHLVAPSQGAESLGLHKIKGYKMYSVGGYPFVSPDKSGSIVVELFNIPDQKASDSIHRMETGAGYELQEIEVNGKKYGIYVGVGYNPENYPEIESGDWTDYRKTNSRF